MRALRLASTISTISTILSLKLKWIHWMHDLHSIKTANGTQSYSNNINCLWKYYSLRVYIICYIYYVSDVKKVWMISVNIGDWMDCLDWNSKKKNGVKFVICHFQYLFLQRIEYLQLLSSHAQIKFEKHTIYICSPCITTYSF